MGKRMSLPSALRPRTALSLMTCLTALSMIFSAGIAVLFDIAYGDTIDEKRILIVSYSRTGKSQIVSDTLAEHLNADAVGLVDKKDRSGLWGYIGAAIDTKSAKFTTTEPARIDLSPYSEIILISPVWSFKLSVATRTFMHNHQLEGKNVLLFTTASADIYQYDKYDDQASFIKRKLKSFMKKKREAFKDTITETGARFLGHYHIATRNATTEYIKEETKKWLCQGQQDLGWQINPSLACP